MYSAQDSEDLELRHYVDVLRRRKLTILASVAVTLIAGVLFTLVQTPVYRSTAEILIEAPLSERIFAPTDTRSNPAGADSDVATQVVVLESNSVRQAAEQAVGKKVDVEIARVADTAVVAVTATAGNADEAARIAQAYTNGYVAIRRDRQTVELRTTTEAIKAEIQGLDALVAELDTQIQQLNALIQASLLRETRAPLEAERDQLSQERTAPEARRAELQGRLDRLQVASALAKTGGVEVVSRASKPDKAKPLLLRNLALALALGLLVGVVIAFIRDHFDDSVRTERDLQATLRAPLLGVIPVVSGWRDRKSPMLVSKSAPRSPAAEAYASVRMSLDLAGLADPGRVLQVTSAAPGDGKTTTLSNLGVSFAKTGRRVVLIDCNLRRPRLHAFFGLDNSVGLTSVLSDPTSLSSALQRVPEQEGLQVLTSGPIPMTTSESFSPAHIERVISAVAQDADVVLVDGPPLPVLEAVVVADRADAVLLVAYAGHTSRSDLARAAELLRESKGPLVGALLNASRAKVGHGLTYGREPAHEKRHRFRSLFGRKRRASPRTTTSGGQAAPERVLETMPVDP